MSLFTWVQKATDSRSRSSPRINSRLTKDNPPPLPEVYNVQVDISEQNNYVEEMGQLAEILRQTGEDFQETLEETDQGPATSDQDGEVGAPSVQAEFSVY